MPALANANRIGRLARPPGNSARAARKGNDRMAKKKVTSGGMGFEIALKRLEEIVHRLEEEEIPLETSLKLFEEGQKLARACEDQLRAAENQVRVLMESAGGEIVETDYDEDNEDAPADTIADDGGNQGTDAAAKDDSFGDTDGKSKDKDDDLPF